MNSKCFGRQSRPSSGALACVLQPSAPEDGRDCRPKRVELIGIVNKPLLLHLVGYLYYLHQWCTVKQT